MHSNIDIALITETWFTTKQCDSAVTLNDFRFDRKGRTGGGVCKCIYVRSNISDCKVVEFNSAVPDIEILWLQCTISNHLFYVACCYHPPKPKYDPAALVNKFNADLQFIIDIQTCPLIVIAGDFNSFDTTFLETDFGLTQIVTEPTHGFNTLDKVFVNRPDIYVTNVIGSLLKTKHRAVVIRPSHDYMCLRHSSSKRKKLSCLTCDSII